MVTKTFTVRPWEAYGLAVALFNKGDFAHACLTAGAILRYAMHPTSNAWIHLSNKQMLKLATIRLSSISQLSPEEREKARQTEGEPIGVQGYEL